MTQPRAPSSLPEDLSIRARRGELGAEELRLLEQALSAHASVRAAHQVGRDFDQELQVRAGDDEIVLRASARALERQRPRGQRRVALAAVLGAAALVASAVAASALWPSSRSSGLGGGLAPHQPASTPALSPSRPEPASEASPPESAAKLGPSARSPSSTTKGKLGMPPVAVGEARALPSTRTDAETAASLFGEAGAARRAGELGLARSKYTELQAKFPNSSEAYVSRVSLGKLLLAAGRAREAEREFSAYLAQGGPVLVEEALVGRAEALGQLRESGEERRVWQELLRRSSSSVYAARARQRLQALGPASDPGFPLE